MVQFKSLTQFSCEKIQLFLALVMAQPPVIINIVHETLVLRCHEANKSVSGFVESLGRYTGTFIISPDHFLQYQHFAEYLSLFLTLLGPYAEMYPDPKSDRCILPNTSSNCIKRCFWKNTVIHILGYHYWLFMYLQWCSDPQKWSVDKETGGKAGCQGRRTQCEYDQPGLG